MKRFVSYLYAVENQKKTQNAGFARIEQRPGKNRVEIHLRDGRYSGKKGKVYLYLRKDGILHGFLLGEIEFRGNQADFNFVQGKNNLLETQYTLEEMNGILIQIDEQVGYLSQWDEEVIDLSTFQVWQKKEAELDITESQKEALKEQSKHETDQPSLRKTDVSSAAQLQPVAVFGMTDLQRAETQRTGLQRSETQRAILQDTGVQGAKTQSANEQRIELQKEESWSDRWERMQHTYPALDRRDGEEDFNCIKIELKDLRMLPKHVWNVMNNSFLVHGFFNYRYLVFGKIGQNWTIGVPGVFQNQEHVMASIFGFPEFLPYNTKGNGPDGFGFWYRIIKLD